MTIEVSLLISAVSVAFAIYCGLKNNRRADTKDIERRVEERAETKAMLNIINSTTQEIKGRVVTMDDKIKEHDTRITIVEQSTKSAHHRLDRIEEKEDE